MQGQIPEWTNGADCNSAGYAFGGSNPSLPTTLQKKQMRTSRASKSRSKFTWLCRAQPRMPSLRSKCGNSSADRALAFQAGGRGFESRFPLTETTSTKVGVVFLYRPLKVYFHKGNTKKQPKLRKQQVVSVKAPPLRDGRTKWANPEIE